MALALLGLPVGAGPRGGSAVADVREPPGLGIRLVDVPTRASDDPRARQYIIDQLAPGSTIARRVEVVNGTSKPVQAKVYAAAADVTPAGFLVAAGHSQDELSRWTTTAPRSLDLGPGERAYSTVTVSVPADAASGERYAVAWAETTTRPTTAGGVTQVGRVGVRLYVQVGKGAVVPSGFEVLGLAASREADHSAVVTATVQNTGRRALDLGGSLTLRRGPGGLSVGPVPTTGGRTLAIGKTAEIAVRLDPRLPDGPWQAAMTLSSGSIRHTARATVTFPSAVGTGSVSPTRRPRAPLVAGIGAGVAVLAAGVVVGLLLRRRRRRAAAPAGTLPPGGSS